MNNGTYAGFNLSASTAGATGGGLGSGYDFYITLTSINLNVITIGNAYLTSPLEFGFDFLQFNNITDTLSVSGVAVTGVPEPVSLGLLVMGGAALLGRRRTQRIIN